MRLPAAMSVDRAVRSGATEPGDCPAATETKTASGKTPAKRLDFRLMRELYGFRLWTSDFEAYNVGSHGGDPGRVRAGRAPRARSARRRGVRAGDHERSDRASRARGRRRRRACHARTAAEKRADHVAARRG